MNLIAEYCDLQCFICENMRSSVLVVLEENNDIRFKLLHCVTC